MQKIMTPHKNAEQSVSPNVLSHTATWTFWAGALLFVGVVGFCFVGPFLDRVNPNAIHLAVMGQSPGLRHLLGTDSLGRSEMARLMYGGRPLILIGLVAALVASVVGVTVGLLAGFMGGGVDRIITWVTDVLLSVPQLVPLLLVEALFKASTGSMIAIIAVTSWPLVARPIRAEVLALREESFIAASQAIGASNARLIVYHVIPNLWSILAVGISNSVGNAVLAVATVAFLGFGLPPPAPNWASMIAHSLSVVYVGYWWLLVFPGVALVILQLSINLLTDAVRAMGFRGQEGSV